MRVLVEFVARRDALAIVRRDAEAGVLQPQRSKHPLLQRHIDGLAGEALDDGPLHFLLEAVAKMRARLRFERKLGELGDQVVVRAAPEVGRRIERVDLRIDAAEQRPEGEACRGRHDVAHQHRPVERNEAAIGVHHLEIGELGQEFRHGIVELPLALLVEGQHGDRDHRLGHRGDAEDRILAQRRAGLERLKAVAGGLHQLAVTGDHHADPGIVAGVDLGLHRAVHAGEAFGRETDGGGVGLGPRRGLGVHGRIGGHAVPLRETLMQIFCVNEAIDNRSAILTQGVCIKIIADHLR